MAKEQLHVVEVRSGLEQLAGELSSKISKIEIDRLQRASGYQPHEPTAVPLASLRGVSAAYTATMGIRLRAGRALATTDDENGQRVALVNETFVRRYFSATNPIGRTVYTGDRDGTAYVVVGVVADVRHRSLEADVRPEMLIPYVQLDPGFVTAFGRGLAVVVHTELPVAAAATLLRAQVRQIDANVAVIDLRPMEQLVRDATSALRFRTFVLTVVAAMALVLSAVGVFGVLAYTVSQRSTEIGVRLALGARPATVFGQVLRQGGKLIVTGAILGLALSAALGRALEGLLFNISPSDPLTYTAATVVLALVALSAATVPAWRATQVNPVTALRG